MEPCVDVVREEMTEDKNTSGDKKQNGGPPGFVDHVVCDPSLLFLVEKVVAETVQAR